MPVCISVRERMKGVQAVYLNVGGGIGTRARADASVDGVQMCIHCLSA